MIAQASDALTRRPRLSAWKRTLQRYLVPRSVKSAWFLMRDRAIVSPSARVQLDRDLRFGSGTVIKSSTIIQTSGGQVSFGDGCRISSFNHIAAGSGADLVVGHNVLTGPHVAIIATSREYGRRATPIFKQGYKDKGIVIGSDVLIGAHSVLVDGCQIGDGAVIGVGSVVTGKVEPYVVVAGAPAKAVFTRR